MKPIPVSAVPEFELVKVNANVAVPFSGMVVIGTAAVPPPDAASPVFVSVYVNVVGVGTLAIVNGPLYPATPTPAIVTLWPVRKPCALTVVIVTVDPDSVAPDGDAAIWLINSNALLIDGGAITVRVAVLLATPVPPSFDWGGLA